MSDDLAKNESSQSSRPELEAGDLDVEGPGPDAGESEFQDSQLERTTGDLAVPQAIARLSAQLLPHAVTPGALHVVSTPIGHLADISIRALAILREVNAVCCEDTRTSRTLLQRYGIHTPMVALHEHNEAQTTPRVLERLRAGESIALVSDAGTPLVSDPGSRLVEAAAAEGVRVIPVPGASATLAALVASGITPHPCTILGFLPRKGGERAEAIKLATSLPHAVIMFEASGRVAQTLRDLAAIGGGNRQAAVARELTKKFEEIRRGTLDELAAYYEDTGPRGEIVLVLGGATVVAPTESDLAAIAADLRAEGRRPREIVQLLMDEHAASRNLAYRLAHDT